MQLAQLLMIQLQPKPRRAGDLHAAIDNRQFATLDHLLIRLLPRVMGVAGVIQIRHRRRDMRHRHEADTQVRVGMHRHTETEHIAHFRQRLRVAQAAPVMVIGKHDLHTILRNAATELVEIGDHHVGRQRQTSALVQFGHAVEARGRVFVILQIIAEQFGHANRGFQRPVAVRIDAQRVTGKSLFQRFDARHFMLRRQRPGLEFDAFETVRLDHPRGLRNDLLLAECFAPVVRLVRRIDMLRILEEQVSAERHFIANGTAEQIHQRHIQVMRLQIEEGYFERRISIAHRFAGMRTGREFGTGNSGGFVGGNGGLHDRA
ncbi:hypothetical protein D3C72_693810 [compost metagenome]